MKNLQGKTRKDTNPYEVWVTPDGAWTWYVLKKYQSPDKEKENVYARWFCKVISPITPEGELGDCYVKEIMSVAIRIQ